MMFFSEVQENMMTFGYLFPNIKPSRRKKVVLKLASTRNFLAHLSRRLTGELIGYPWIWRPSSSSVVRPSTFSNIFFSETALPIKAKFYVEPPWEGATKVYINSPGHMTKMAAIPIYGKTLQKSSPEPAGRFSRNLVCSIGDSCPS